MALIASIVAVSPANAQVSEMLISAKALSNHECDSTVWHFVINQIESEDAAPTTIHVVWKNGNSEDVGIEKFTGGTAHYSSWSNLDSAVDEATAYIYSSWTGQFNLSHGPCECPTETPTDVPTPTWTPTDPTPTETLTTTPTDDPTPTGTVTVTNTPTDDPTITPTDTVTITQSPTPTEPPLGGESRSAGFPTWYVLAGVVGLVIFSLLRKQLKLKA